MSNSEFIKRYGIKEFYALSQDVSDILSVWKINGEIRHFKCSNRKKRAILYLNNKTTKYVDYAEIVIAKEKILH